MTLFILTIIVAVGLGGLTVFQAWDKLKSDKIADDERTAADSARAEARVAQKRADDYFKKLGEAQAKIEELNKISLKKADDIITKNEQLIQAQSETIKQVLGDGIVKILVGNSANNEPRFALENTGNYTARDIRINATEFTPELRAKFQSGSFKRSDLAQNHIPIPDFPYLKAKQAEVFKISGNDSNQRAYQFSIYCQHATFMQYIVLYKDQHDQKWYSYFKLYQVVNNEWILLQESASNNGPAGQSYVHLFDKYFIIGPYTIIQDL